MEKLRDRARAYRVKSGGRYRAGDGAFTNTDLKARGLRTWFLGTLDSEAPGVAQDLARRVRAAVQPPTTPASTSGSVTYADLRALRQRFAPTLEPIIQTWARRYHLDAPWVRTVVRDNVLLWLRSPDLPARWYIMPTVATTLPSGPRPEGVLAAEPHVEPTDVTMTEFRRQVGAPAARQVLALYRADPNFYRAPANRDPELMGLLVRYQVKGESLWEIAGTQGDDADSARNAVWKTVSRLASEMGLPLRPPLPKGRKSRAR